MNLIHHFSFFQFPFKLLIWRRLVGNAGWIQKCCKGNYLCNWPTRSATNFSSQVEESKRAIPLVTPGVKLLHCHTALKLPRCILGLLSLIAPSVSTRRNLVLPSVQFPIKLLWAAIRSPLSCCFTRLNKTRFLSLFSKVTYFWPVTVLLPLC